MLTDAPVGLANAACGADPIVDFVLVQGGPNVSHVTP